MKKLFLIVTLVFCTNTFLKAQITALPTDSAMWFYRVGLQENYTEVGRNLTVKVKGDTLLGGIAYSKVYYAWGHDTAYNSPHNLLHCFIRSDTSLKAYVRYPISYNGDTSDILLYDFKQQVGDTFNLPIFQSNNQYGMNCNGTFKYVVSGVMIYWDTFLNFNDKIIQYSPANDGCTFSFSQFNEFMGSADFVFYNELQECDYDYGCTSDSLLDAQIVCFWNKGNWIANCVYFYDDDVSENSYQNSDIHIYPNPISDVSELKFAAGRYTVFELYTIYGEIVYKTDILKDENTLQLAKQNLGAGVYFGKLSGEKHYTGIIKIIIN